MHEHPRDQGDGDPLAGGTTWEDFRGARDRFLARLAELSEISRLERAWALAPHRGPGDDSPPEGR